MNDITECITTNTIFLSTYKYHVFLYIVLYYPIPSFFNFSILFLYRIFVKDYLHVTPVGGNIDHS